jgi:hypothetical protein
MIMGEKIFGTLLRLYPTGFQRRYSLELIEFFRTDWREAIEARSLRGILGFWSHTVVDLVAAVFRVRLRSRFKNPLRSGGRGPSPAGGKRPGGTRFMDGLYQDIRFALRTLMKRPAFTIISVGVLGVGIGASTTLFSAVDAVLLLPLPYPEADRLVSLGSKFPQGTRINSMSIPELMDVMDAVGSVEQYAAARGRALDLVGEGEPERVSVAEVSPSYFRVFGITPTLGAGFTPADHQVENARVVLVSDGLWRRRWGGCFGLGHRDLTGDP